MSTRREKFDLATEVYSFIRRNPMTSRVDINGEFKTLGNDVLNSQVSEAIDSLLHLRYVFRHRDTDSNSVFFWISTFRSSPYAPDDMAHLVVEDAVDIFGKPPELEAPPIAPAKPAPGYKPQGQVTQQTAEPVKVTAMLAEEKHWEEIHNKLHGVLKAIYGLLLSSPDKVFAKNDSWLVTLVPDSSSRARFLGRLWALGVGVRRARDGDSLFFTLRGVFPATMKEEFHEMSKAAQKRMVKLEEKVKRVSGMDALRDSLVKDAVKHMGIADQDTVEEDADLDEDDEEDQATGDVKVPDAKAGVDLEEAQEDMLASAYVDQDFNFVMIRSDGTTLEFDEEENEAWRRLILNINIQRLERIQNGND